MPLGELTQAKAKGFDKTGAYGLGGSIALGSGVVFIGGTADSTFRAFDASSGETLWEMQMKASVYATPSGPVTTTVHFPGLAVLRSRVPTLVLPAAVQTRWTWRSGSR